MARIQTTGLISDISGRMQGTTFQRSQSGLIMRTQRGVKRSNTGLQQYNKVGINEIMLTWTSLTQGQREQWNQYAIYRGIKQKHNNTKMISGHQIFIRENSLRYSMKDYGTIFVNPIHATPLFSQPPINFTFDGIFNIANSLFVNTIELPDDTYQGLLYWISAPITESRQSRYTKRTMIKFITTNSTGQDITNYYTSVFGRIPNVGEFVSLEIGLYDDNVKTYTKNTPIITQVG